MEVAFDGTQCVIINATLAVLDAVEDDGMCAGGWIQQLTLPRNFGFLVAWLFILGWIFLGVAMGADVFMASIEMITSKEVTRTVTLRSGKQKTFHVRMWNDTIANLTLMALGSSAPEILINVLEVVLGNFYAGALGPSTIVGSAAFNLMVITGVCVAAIPEGETRSIKSLSVFLVTATFSVVAYLWLFVIVAISSPDVIEVHEGVITIALLGVLLAIAYYFDKRDNPSIKLRLKSPYRGDDDDGRRQINVESWEIVKEAGLFGAGEDERTPEQLAEALKALAPPKTRAQYRRELMVGLPGHVFVGGTAPPSGAALRRSASSGNLKVRPSDAPAGADTSLGSASSVEAQQQRGGSPAPGTSPKPLQKALSSPNMLDVAVPRHSKAEKVPSAGMLRWVEETASVMESAGSITLRVERVGGSLGELTVQYATKDQQARAGKDYENASGMLKWESGDMKPKELHVKILDDDELEKDETFTIVLSKITGDAIFDVETDGGLSEAICTVTIINDDARATRFSKALQILHMDMDALDLSRISWGEQVKAAVACPEGAGPMGIAIFVLTLPWRLIFSLVPPPELGGGWPCFWLALLFIGGQVLLISDFANQLGCQMNIKPGLTAITFVALGTSLPDLFASKQAAVGDSTADNSVGNVTGSNSVNVFFGLGLPWTLAALRWAIGGATAEWCSTYADLPHVLERFPSGAFVVKKGDLGFSVVIFCICALLTIASILLRRPAELGGGKAGKYATAIFFVILWLAYVIISALALEGLIPTF